MAKRNRIAEAADRTPSVVLAAFAPETEFECSLDAWLLLEALQSPLCQGETPGMRDLLLAALVFTDLPAVRTARKTGKLEDLLARATAGKRPADLLGLPEKVTAAIRAGFAPLDSGTDSAEKKSSAAPAGG